MASLVERLRQYASTHGMLTDADREWFGQAHDEVAALEAMCETLAGALEPFAANIEYVTEFLHAGDDETVERPPYLAGDYRSASQALTQYRAMKEKNDG